jgi:hypothetical protein
MSRWKMKTLPCRDTRRPNWRNASTRMAVGRICPSTFRRQLMVSKLPYRERRSSARMAHNVACPGQ